METIENTPKNAETIEVQVAEILAREGIEYKAVFVPTSRAKRSWKGTGGEEIPVASWEISLKKETRSFKTIWSAGWGHYFNQKWGRIASLYDWVKRAMETGERPIDEKYVYTDRVPPTEPLPAPRPGEVLYSLTMDAEVLEYGSFEEWAREFGYEEDSREAERVYSACLKETLSLRAVLGESLITELAEAVREY